MKRTNSHLQSYVTTPTTLRPCFFGKTRYTTMGHAQHALRKRETPTETRRFAVERCQSCSYFHVEVVGGVGPMPDFGQLRAEGPPSAQRPSGWNLDLKPVATCSRAKRRHYSIEEAEAEIAKLVGRGVHEPERGTLNVYECSSCEAFHIGHSYCSPASQA